MPSYIYTLTLHDALPIFVKSMPGSVFKAPIVMLPSLRESCLNALFGVFVSPTITTSGSFIFGNGILQFARDRKSTRLNFSHMSISYAVFCLKKKKLYYEN